MPSLTGQTKTHNVQALLQEEAEVEVALEEVLLVVVPEVLLKLLDRKAARLGEVLLQRL